mgnify:FL=1
MKIVFISHLAHSQGGAQGVLVDLIKGLKQYYPEYQIYIIFPKKGDLIDICSPYINGYKIIKQPWWIIPGKKIKCHTAIGRFFRIVKYAIKTLQYLRKIQPDFVITNTLASPTAALAAYWGKFKHIWFIHEIPTLSTDCTFLYREKYICKYIENSSIKILSVSEAISTYYSRYLTDKTKIERIHYAIEIPSITSTPNHIYTLIMVGSFNENKGQKEAVYASNIVKNKYQIPFQLLLVGANKDKYTHEVKEIIKQEGLTQQIKVIDFTSSIIDYYQQADVLITCSASEGLPRVIIEAQKLGIPVIATSIQPNKELIESGYNGLLYQRGSYSELAQHIIELTDKQKRKKMSEHAVNRIKDLYTMKGFITEFTKTIDKYE